MEKVQREVTMKTGKKLMAILIMATLLIPQSVYGADILSENVVGAQAVSDESRVSQGIRESGQGSRRDHRIRGRKRSN